MAGFSQTDRTRLRRIAVVHVPEIVPNVAFLRVVEAAAPSLGVSVTAAEVRNAADIERVLSALGQEGGGLIVTPSALTATRRDLIIALAASSACLRSIRSVSRLQWGPNVLWDQSARAGAVSSVLR